MKQQRNLVLRLTGTVALIICCLAAFSQEQQTANEYRLTPKFGIKAGLNLSNLYVDNVSDEHMKVGFNAGFYGKLPVSRGVSIQPEVIYSLKGSQLHYNNVLQGSGTYRFNLGYIEVPVLMVVNVAKNFNLHVGGYGAVLVNANVKDVDNNGDIQGTTDLNRDNFQTFDYGLIGGLGIDVGNVTLGARYNYGLHKIGKTGLSGDLTEHSKNSVIGLYVGFGF